MKLFAKTNILIILATLSMTGCSSASKSQDDTYNSPQTQKENARKAQRELSSETAR